MERPNDGSTSYSALKAIFFEKKGNCVTKFKQKEGTSYGFEATEYPDSLGR
jgi:hypothetical protein